jgi:hypothetical protein
MPKEKTEGLNLRQIEVKIEEEDNESESHIGSKKNT